MEVGRNVNPVDFCIRVDNGFDRLPILSTLSNVVVLFAKTFFNAIEYVVPGNFDSNNTFVHFRDKSFLRILKLIFHPFHANYVYYKMDKAEETRLQLEMDKTKDTSLNSQPTDGVNIQKAADLDQLKALENLAIDYEPLNTSEEFRSKAVEKGSTLLPVKDILKQIDRNKKETIESVRKQLEEFLTENQDNDYAHLALGILTEVRSEEPKTYYTAAANLENSIACFLIYKHLLRGTGGFDQNKEEAEAFRNRALTLGYEGAKKPCSSDIPITKNEKNKLMRLLTSLV